MHGESEAKIYFIKHATLPILRVEGVIAEEDYKQLLYLIVEFIEIAQEAGAKTIQELENPQPIEKGLTSIVAKLLFQNSAEISSFINLLETMLS